MDPFRLVSEEVAKGDAGGNMPEVTRAASTVPPAGHQDVGYGEWHLAEGARRPDVGYGEWHLAEGARRPILAMKEVAVRCVRVPNT